MCESSFIECDDKISVAFEISAALESFGVGLLSNNDKKNSLKNCWDDFQ